MLVDYDSCFHRLIVHEGGYTDDPRDPGGPTNYGITIEDARKYGAKYHWVADPTIHDMETMPFWFAEDVYKPEYWDALQCDRLPAGVDDSVFDYGVNSGISRSGKVLRRVLGLPDRDWHIDSGVLAALKDRDPVAVIMAINNERLQFLRGLSTFDRFGHGWTIRVKEVRTYSLLLAAKARGNEAAQSAVKQAVFTAPAPGQTMAKGIVPKPDIPSGTAIGGFATALASSAMINAHVTLPHVAMAAGAAAVAIGGVAYAMHLKHQHDFSVMQDAPSGPVTVVPSLA